MCSRDDDPSEMTRIDDANYPERRPAIGDRVVSVVRIREWTFDIIIPRGDYGTVVAIGRDTAAGWAQVLFDSAVTAAGIPFRLAVKIGGYADAHAHFLHREERRQDQAHPSETAHAHLMTLAYCNADCGCAGGQPARYCNFDPWCNRCMDNEQP